MEYRDIILDNCKNHSAVSWWPRFAFHYTDVTNAVSILNTGTLFSRTDAKRLHIMRNDNASRQVIDMTSSGAVSFVRFYFRPLTPTQYYNEGYKHPSIRYDGDEMANIPVPIFFLFDLEGILSLRNTQFSEISMAGNGTALCSGVEAFSKLNFDAIYSNGVANFEQNKAYRQAEIVHSGPLPIDNYLKTILCRSTQDQITLLNLMRKQNRLAYEKNKRKIKVYKKDTFQNNGLCVENCAFHNNSLSITFGDSSQKSYYMNSMMHKQNLDFLRPIHVKIVCIWSNTRSTVYQEAFTTQIDYSHPSPIMIKNMPMIQNAREIGVQIFFDDKMVCYYRQPLDFVEVIK